MRRSRRGRRPKGRNSSAVSTAPILRVRAARSGGGPKAQRAGPAILRIALLALSSSGSKPGGLKRAWRVAGLRGRKLRPARLYEPQKLSQQFNPKQSPPHSPMLGLARRENRNRFSRPKNSHSPKHSPILRPVCASLRLRFRSAAFFARLRDSSIFGSRQSFLNKIFQSARCAIHLYSAHAEIVESLL